MKNVLRHDIAFLQNEFLSYFNASQLTNVGLVCDNGTAKVHQLILSHVSPMLKQALFNAVESSDDMFVTILLPGYKLENVLELLSRVYGSEEGSETISEDEHKLMSTLNMSGVSCNIVSPSPTQPVATTLIEVKPEFVSDTNWWDYDVGSHQDGAISEPDESDVLLVPTDSGSLSVSSGRRKPYRRKRGIPTVNIQTIKEDGSASRKRVISWPDEADDTMLPPVKKGWKCSECDAMLSSSVKLSEHFKTHHQEGMLQHLAPGIGDYCAPCKTSFSNGISELKSHLVDDCCVNRVGGGSVRVYICNPCPLVFYCGKAFDQHMVQHQEAWSCRVCNETFRDSGTYFNHVSTNHRNFIERSFKCHICPRAFTMEFKLIKHLDYHVNGNNGNIADDERRIPVSSKGTYTVVNCQHCSKMFTNRRNLNSHLKTHKEASFCCPRCPRKFKSKRGLGYHIKMHDGRTEFLCDDCGRGFVCRQKLQLHRRTKHTFEKPYICDQCGVAFVRSENLTVHKRRVHTGEKPYTCKHCDWVGVDSSSLCHHRKKHQGEQTI